MDKHGICESNRDILEVIWHLGRGIMFRSQLKLYMARFFDYKEFDLIDRLAHLEVFQVVEKLNYHGNVILKLRKFALQFLLNKSREQVSAIQVNPSKVKRTAFNNAIILDTIRKTDAFSELAFDELLERYIEKSMLCLSEREGYKALEHYKRYLDPQGLDEIIALKKKEIENNANLNSYRGKDLQWGNTVSYAYNLINMAFQGVFINLLTKTHPFTGENVPTLHIAIPDLNDTLSVISLGQKVFESFSYLDSIFVPNHSSEAFPFHYHFTVYVSCGTRKIYLESFRKLINQKLTANHIMTRMSWEVVDLNIKPRLFKASKLSI